MSRPSTSAVAVFIGILVVFVVVSTAIVAGGPGQTGLTVGDTSFSRDSIDRELRALAENEVLASESPGLSVGAGSVIADAGTQIVTIMARTELLRQYLRGAGEAVTNADLPTRAEIGELTGFGTSFSAFPQWFQDRWVERVAINSAFTRVTGADTDNGARAQLVLERLVRRVPVSVEAEYGRWSKARLAVVPYPTPAG